MDKDTFAKRLSALRLNKGVSARDMSLSIGLSEGYINNVENCVNFPSMEVFFYICEYLGVTPKEFFDSDIPEPQMVCHLMKLAKQLPADDLAVLINMAERLIQK